MKIDRDHLHDLTRKTYQVFMQESAEVRPKDINGLPGGLIRLAPHKTTIVVPDLHARTSFLKDLLQYSLDGKTIAWMLENDLVQIVCVGDGMHGELRVAARWKVALQEYRDGFQNCPAMIEEMEESFETMSTVMELKIRYPDRFHFLKGNHENILDSNQNGNHSFAKFAAEGVMTRYFVEKFLGRAFLKDYETFENNLPLLALGPHFAISHARPKTVYSLEEVINYRGNSFLIEGLTWTRDPMAEPDCTNNMLSRYFRRSFGETFWMAGHSPVSGKYRHYESESLILIHNPKARPVAIIRPNIKFDPERDILLLPRRDSDYD